MFTHWGNENQHFMNECSKLYFSLRRILTFLSNGIVDITLPNGIVDILSNVLFPIKKNTLQFMFIAYAHVKCWIADVVKRAFNDFCHNRLNSSPQR